MYFICIPFFRNAELQLIFIILLFALEHSLGFLEVTQKWYSTDKVMIRQPYRVLVLVTGSMCAFVCVLNLSPVCLWACLFNCECMCLYLYVYNSKCPSIHFTSDLNGYGRDRKPEMSSSQLKLPGN